MEEFSFIEGTNYECSFTVLENMGDIISVDIEKIEDHVFQIVSANRGKIVYESSLQPHFEINLSFLDSGKYVLRWFNKKSDKTASPIAKLNVIPRIK